ncbi:MAG: YihY/virulence factor BrkB family protein [Thiohalobacteraceae bacterium]
MSGFLAKSREAVVGFIWDGDLRSMSTPRRQVTRVLRLSYVMLREFSTGELNLRAMSMVYTTLLSVVPLLAFSFALLKGFGVTNQLEPVLYRFLEPLGPKGTEVAGYIIGFVANIKIGVLGSLGLGLLIYTVLSLLQKMEASFNYAWRVEQPRGFGQRFSNYLSVILVGPLLVFSALGLTATVSSNRLVQWLIGIEPFGTLVLETARFIPYLLVVAAFTFFYMFVPNTRVKLRAAVVGGLVAGFLWQSTGWAFAAFIATSSKYAAIYSSFAILLMLLIWLYINWLVLLLGAQIAFFIQHPQYLTRTPVRLTLSNRLKERLALALMYLVADHHHRHAPAWNADGLAARLDVPVAPLQRLITALITLGYLTETNMEPPNLVPARDISTVGIADLLDDVRAADESRFLQEDRLPAPAPVDEVVERIDQSRAAVLKSLTLRDLL